MRKSELEEYSQRLAEVLKTDRGWASLRPTRKFGTLATALETIDTCRPKKRDALIDDILETIARCFIEASLSQGVDPETLKNYIAAKERARGQ